MTNVVEILSQCPLFSAVPERSFQRLVAIARLCKYRKGQLIFREKDACPGTFVVGKGMVRVFKTGPGGKEHVLHIVGPYGTFAEVASMGGFDVPASAEAVEPTVCVLLPQAQLREKLEEDHPLCLGLMTGLTGWVRHLVGLIEDIALRDAAGRIARYLLESRPATDGMVHLPSLKRHVANHLNLTSETFSRTFRRLLDAQFIAVADKNRVRIIDRDKLHLVAEGMFPKL